MQTEKLLISNDKKIKLEVMREKVEKITDKLGKPIDGGIKETVVLLQAFDLRTSQSCDGHPEKGDKAKPPWVKIYPETPPDEEEWWEDEKLREGVKRETNELRLRAEKLLAEFYKNRDSSNDVRLGLRGVAYGFRIQSAGLKSLIELPDSERIEKVKEYRKEMEDFTKFLQNRYLQPTTTS